MNPDPRERLPREIFEELMEEGAEAFRNVLEKLLNHGTGAIRVFGSGRTSRRRDHPTASRTRPWPRGLKLKIPQVKSFYPKSLERGCRSETLKLAIAEMYVKGV